MNLLDLYAKVIFDDSEYTSGLAKAGKAADTFGAKIKTGLVNAAKLGASAVGVVTAAVGALSTVAIKNYAEYEQLVGGIETLFKNSAGLVHMYAMNAYETAGMSANEYMETVTGFSASLLQSLGGDTKKAANYADMAIRDMSDNANKMGSSMEMLQNAYQGFAKQNFTMLDNLKLGYGGTQEEMERLLEDAEKIKTAQGELVDYSIDSYADIVDAIHTVQGEMGITGTTAEEVYKTISGSLSATKAAWSNLVTGIANDNADFEDLVKKFVDSVGVAAGNIVPRIGVALDGVGLLIETMFPIILDEIPAIIDRWLPNLLTSGLHIIETLSKGIRENLPAITKGAGDTFFTFVSGVASQIPNLFSLASDLVTNFGQYIIDNPDKVVESAGSILTSFATGIVDLLSDLSQTAVDVVIALGGYLVDHAGDIASGAIAVGEKIVYGIWDGIVGIWDSVIDIPGLLDGINVGINYSLTGNVPSVPVTGLGGHGGRGGSFAAVSVHGSHAEGLGYVPFDGYIAELHKGERVLTAKESEQYGTTSFGDVIININGAHYSDEESLTEAIADSLSMLVERRSASFAN